MAWKLGATVRCKAGYLVLERLGQAMFFDVNAMNSKRGGGLNKTGNSFKRMGGISGILKDIGGI
jgi:hypothetical protein